MSRSICFITKSKRRLTFFSVLFVSLVAVIGAVAYFTSHGTGTATASTGTLAAPTGVTVPASATNTVAVSWTGTTGPDGSAVRGYYVQRYGGTPSPANACGTDPANAATWIAAGTDPHSCTDSPTADGTYTYKVTAGWRSWTAQSAASGSVAFVNRVSSSTALASSANPSLVGQQVTYAATVTAASLGTPTGNVEFFDGSTPIAVCGGSTGQTLNGSTVATCQVTYAAVSAGHSISAQYLGDTHHFGSTSPTVSQVVNQAATTTAVVSSANPSVFGQSVTFTATVSPTAPGGGTPTGTVNFKDGSANLCTNVVLSGGSATCTPSSLSGGSHTIKATYLGDTNYVTSASANFAQTVSKANQTISFTSTAPANAKVAGATYTPSATATSGLTVAFTIDATASSVCSISAGVVSFQAVGTCVIDANQAGDGNYSAAPQVQQSFGVAKGDQTISFAALANRTFDQGPITVSATATSGLAVAFTSATASVCTVSGSTVTFIAVGTCTINADQAGNGNWNAAPQVQRSFTISKGNQTITFGTLASVRLDQTAPTPSATASSGLAVTFSSTTTSTCTISGSTITLLHAGTCTIAADQPGNANWNAAPQVPQSFTVSKGNQTINFGTLAAKTFDQGPITVSATASSGLAVTFTSATTGICTVSGSTVTFVTTGTCTINADQAGNTDWTAATQVPQSFTISKGNQTITFGTLADRQLNQSPFTVTATASSGLAVAFTSATTPVCSVTGSTVTLIKVGTCTITANQDGNANWNAASQVQQSFTVTKGNQTITFGALANQRLDQSPVPLTATASSGLAVTYSSSTATICTVSGSSVTLLHIGTCTINAAQAGDTNWNPATTVTQSFTISKGTQTVTFGAAPTFPRTAVAASVSATATSALAVLFGTNTSSVCTVNSSTGALSLLTIGLCTITGDQGGNTDWNAATQATQGFQVYSGNVTGLVWTGVTAGATCTGSGTANVDCTITGAASNATITATIAFSNAAGNASVFSAQGQTLNVSGGGKASNPVTVAVNANQSTATASVSAQKNGGSAASATVTFTTPSGSTWTATLHIS